MEGLSINDEYPFVIDPMKFVKSLENDNKQKFLLELESIIKKNKSNIYILRNKELFKNLQEDGLSLFIKTTIEIAKDIDLYSVLNTCYSLIEKLSSPILPEHCHYELEIEICVKEVQSDPLTFAQAAFLIKRASLNSELNQGLVLFFILFLRRSMFVRSSIKHENTSFQS